MAQALPAAVIGAANLSEVVGKLRDHGLSVEEVEEVLGSLHLRVRPLTPAQGYAAGYLRPATRIFGLSLSDRACLALAAELAPEGTGPSSTSGDRCAQLVQQGAQQTKPQGGMNAPARQLNTSGPQYLPAALIHVPDCRTCSAR